MVDFLLSEGYKFQLVKDEYTNHEFYQVLHVEVPWDSIGEWGVFLLLSERKRR